MQGVHQNRTQHVWIVPGWYPRGWWLSGSPATTPDPDHFPQSPLPPQSLHCALTKSWRDFSEEEDELFQCCRVLYIHRRNHRTMLGVDVHNEKCIIILWVYSTIVECDRVIGTVCCYNNSICTITESTERGLCERRGTSYLLHYCRCVLASFQDSASCTLLTFELT